jgi:hypothetical protein
MTDDTIPNPYSHPLAALRAAVAKAPTPFEQFEARWKAARLRQLELEQPHLDADAADAVRTLAEHRREAQVDLAGYAPPDPYAAGLKAMQENSR